jgi:acyl-CoA hydrolase
MDLSKNEEEKVKIMGKIVELTLAQVMMPHQANVAGNVHGGEIMKLMDIAAGSVATKYSKGPAVTARVDEIQFLLPIFVGAFVSCTARLAYVGRSSMEIIVTVEVEDLEMDTEPQQALSAFFTMVALDKVGRPKKLSPLELETEEDKRLCEMAATRRAGYKKHGGGPVGA